MCVQWKTPDDGQRNYPKHVEFYSKNSFEKLVHLVGFIIRISHDARSPDRQMLQEIYQQLEVSPQKRMSLLVLFLFLNKSAARKYETL